MSQGLWQYVTSKNALIPTTSNQVYDLVLRFSAAPAEALGDHWDSVSAQLDSAARLYGVSRSDLVLYLYSDNPAIIRVIVSAVELDVAALKQPTYLSLALYVDATTGLINRPGLLTKSDSLFPVAAPLSRITPLA